MTTRRRHGPKHVEPKTGFEQWEHGSLTFEGEIERLGAIGRNLSTAPRWARVVAKVVAAMILLPLAVALVMFVVSVFTR